MAQEALGLPSSKWPKLLCPVRIKANKQPRLNVPLVDVWLHDLRRRLVLACERGIEHTLNTLAKVAVVIEQQALPVRRRSSLSTSTKTRSNGVRRRNHHS